MQSISITNIKKGDRAREDFGDIKELAESLATYGFIHPIALDANNQLIAGGRRFEALSLLWKNRVKWLEREDLDPTMRRLLNSGELELGKHYTSKAEADLELTDEMELEENVRRKAFSWKENVIAIFKIHRRKRRDARQRRESWGLRETGRLLNTSYANVQYAIKLYECLQDPHHPIQECNTVTEALHKLTKMRADEARRFAVRQNMDTAQLQPAGVKEYTLDELVQEFPGAPAGETIDGDLDELLAPRAVTTSEASDSEISEVVVSLDGFHHGDFLSLLETGRLAEESVDHILTDPPYGINMDNLKYGSGGGIRNVDRIEETHSVEDNVNNFGKWIEGFYQIMKPNGFCVVFCDYDHFNLLNSLATNVGFKAQRWPFVWCKTHQCMNQAAQYNFTKNTEIACVWRKGSATLVKPQNSSYMMASSLPTKQKLHGHPFVKPLELWQFLANAVSIEGETLCDPFAGVGSMIQALLGRNRIVSCEIDENIYNQQQALIMDFYRKIYENVRFVRSGQEVERCDPITLVDNTEH